MRSGSSEGPIIEIEGLSVRYPSRDIPSIKDVSFSVQRGDFVWLSGDSASGKSTLMNCICGFIPKIIPAELDGNIVVDGEKDPNAIELGTKVGMVHQDPESQFCTEYVEDEIAFGLENFKVPRKEIDRRIEETLEQLNCSHLRHRELRTLSGGEKQKIAIASLLVLNPSVLILDEPTANLDSISMKEVLSAVKEIRKKNEGMTIIIAEHRIKSLSEYVDSLLRLENGRLVRDVEDFQNMPEEERKDLVDYSYPDYERKRKIRNRSVVKIKGLSYEVEENKILDGIDIDIKQGEIVALMGRNGSGKTTLIKHIAGMVDVQSGAIEIFGSRMDKERKIPPWRLGKKIGYVFQNPNHQIFENTVKAEMIFGPENFGEGKKRAKKNLKELLDREGLGSETHPHTLSFGQKRRLNIYSSTNHGPELIIIDEPFSGQDHLNALAMASILDGLWKKGRTLIIVTHDLHFARKFCTRALVLKDGSVVYRGEPEGLKSIEGELKDEG